MTTRAPAFSSRRPPPGRRQGWPPPRAAPSVPMAPPGGWPASSTAIRRPRSPSLASILGGRRSPAGGRFGPSATGIPHRPVELEGERHLIGGRLPPAHPAHERVGGAVAHPVHVARGTVEGEHERPVFSSTRNGARWLSGIRTVTRSLPGVRVTEPTTACGGARRREGRAAAAATQASASCDRRSLRSPLRRPVTAARVPGEEPGIGATGQRSAHGRAVADADVACVPHQLRHEWQAVEEPDLERPAGARGVGPLKWPRRPPTRVSRESSVNGSGRMGPGSGRPRGRAAGRT